MSEQSHTLSSEPRPKSHKRALIGAVALTGLAITGTLLAHEGRETRVSSAPVTTVLPRTYAEGSVRLTSAQLGDRADGASRQPIKIHIDSVTNVDLAQKTSGEPPYWGNSQEDGIEPYEEVIRPDGTEARGLVRWVEGSTKTENAGNAEMSVSLKPYSGGQEVTEKYRMFLPSVANPQGKELDGLYYAGTLDVSGARGKIHSAAIEQEKAVPPYQEFTPPADQGSLLGYGTQPQKFE